MASGISIKIDEEKTNLDSVLEMSRGNDDFLDGRINPIDTKFIKSNDPSTPISKYFQPIDSRFDSGFDISPFIQTYNPSVSLAAKKGHRPRISFGNYFFKEIEGTASLRYYVIKRRETGLNIYWSLDRHSGFSHKYSIPASDFPNSYVPHILTFRLVGSGSGGNGGFFTYGGHGGAGGGILYGWVALTDSLSVTPDPSIDTVFRLFRGGVGGNEDGGYGSYGINSYAFFPNEILIAGGGVAQTSTHAAVGGSYSTSGNHFLAGVNGGSITGTNRELYIGDEVNFNATMLKQNISWHSAGGYYGQESGGGISQAGGGGGASLGDGARGGAESHVGESGTRGSGGGGGSGWAWFGASSEDGGPGGPGVLTLYY